MGPTPKPCQEGFAEDVGINARTISKKLILNINFKVPYLPCATRTLKQILQFTANTNGFAYVPSIKISDRNYCLTEKQKNPEDC